MQGGTLAKIAIALSTARTCRTTELAARILATVKALSSVNISLRSDGHAIGLQGVGQFAHVFDLLAEGWQGALPKHQ